MRRKGTPVQMEAARTALANLYSVTRGQDREMERRGPSEEYERANAAAGEALSKISWWQEWVVYDQVVAADPHARKPWWRKIR